MPAKDFVVSGDGHLLEPTDLFKTRLPKHLRDRGVWDEDFEIERVAAAGFRAILLPATPPKPYYSREFDPVWAAAQACGVHAFFHTQTGGVKVNDPASTTLKVVMESAAQVNQPMTEKSASKRMVMQS